RPMQVTAVRGAVFGRGCASGAGAYMASPHGASGGNVPCFRRFWRGMWLAEAGTRQGRQQLVSYFRWIATGPLGRGAAVSGALLALGAGAASPTGAQKPDTLRLSSARLSILELQKLAAGVDPASLGLGRAGPINGIPAS